jgi:hypothetical protein
LLLFDDESGSYRDASISVSVMSTFFVERGMIILRCFNSPDEACFGVITSLKAFSEIAGAII